MKISELIARLAEMLEEHGDIRVLGGMDEDITRVEADEDPDNEDGRVIIVR